MNVKSNTLREPDNSSLWSWQECEVSESTGLCDILRSLKMIIVSCLLFLVSSLYCICKYLYIPEAVFMFVFQVLGSVCQHCNQQIFQHPLEQTVSFFTFLGNPQKS